jgi:hypothetical protein
MGASPSDLPGGSAALRGSFEKRASKIISNAALHDLVVDLAVAVDKSNRKLDRIIEHLRIEETP